MFRRRPSSDNDARILIANSLVDIDPDYAVSASDLPNRGTGGSGYDLDTNVGTAANRKVHPSGSCLLFGASGDYASTPDSAAADITGDIDIRVKAAADDWSPASAQSFLHKRNPSPGVNESYGFGNQTSGVLSFFHINGTTQTIVSSDAAVSASDGDTLWVRCTWEQSTGNVNFYTSADGSTWDQLGTADLTGPTTAINSGSRNIAVGSTSDGLQQRFIGSIYRAQVYNGIDGTLAVDFDPTNYVSGTTFSSGGVTWTLNGNSFIQNTGHDVLHSIGSNGLETAAGQTIGPVSTVFIVAATTDATPASNAVLLDAKSGTPRNAIYVAAIGSRWAMEQGSQINLTESATSSPALITAQFNADSTSKLTLSGVGSITGDAGNESSPFGALFVAKDGGNYWEGAFYRLLVFDYALSETQVSAIQNYLSAYYGGI